MARLQSSIRINPAGFEMDLSQKEESILILLKELSARQENVLKMYFGIGGSSKKTLEELGQDLDLSVENILQIKNDGICEFIKLIISTGIFGDRSRSYSDEFFEAADSDLLDNFMTKFIGSN